MKKIWLSLSAFWLLAGLQMLAAQVTVSGHITQASDGSPVPQWPVFVNGLDSAQANYAFTDENGYYTLTIADLSPASSSVLVETPDACTGVLVGQTATVLNGAAQADFSICFVTPPPFDSCSAYFDYSPSAANSLSYLFTGHAFGGVDFTYTWEFGDGTTATGQTVEHTYAAAGDYLVTLTAVSAECSTTVEWEIVIWNVYEGPTIDVTVSGNIRYESSGAPVPDWFVLAYGVDPWFPIEGFTDANGHYSMVVTLPDTATIVQVTTFDFCSGPVVVNAPIVNNTAEADFEICNDSIPPSPDCQAYIYYSYDGALTYTFGADVYTNDPANTAVSYVWDFGDGSTSTEANPTHTYAQDGMYTVLLIVTTANGCEAHVCDVICTFGGGVIDTFYYQCQAMFGVAWQYDSMPANPAGSSLTLTFLDFSFGAVQSWSWDFGDNTTSSEQNPTHTYAQSGLYTVTLHIETLDGCESEISMEVYVGDFNPWPEYDCQALYIPVPDSSGNGFFFIDLSLSPAPVQSWSWNFGDGTTSNEQNPYHSYAQPGVYTVTLSIAADSCNSSISFELDTNNPFNRFGGNGGVLGQATGAVSTQQADVFRAARLFPNPATSQIHLMFDSREAGDYELRLTDLSGRTLSRQQRRADAGSNLVPVSLADLNAGVYFLQLHSARDVKTLKLVKQ